MADISKITLPSGSTYNIKDTQARNDIATIQSAITGGMHYLGVTTTALTNGASTNPITIDGNSVTAVSGDIAIYGSLEFIFSDTDSKWHEFGSTGSLKALAFKDNASGSFTPSGSVSKPTFTGASMTSTGSFTPAGSVGLTTTNKTATVAPASSGTATYTPGGTVGTPTITVTPNTTTVNSITAVGSMPTYTVASETLTITAGSTPTKGANTTVVTSIKSATSSQPSWTGTGVRLVTGNIAVPTSASFTGTEGAVSVSGTTTGDVSKPTFTGSAGTVTVS